MAGVAGVAAVVAFVATSDSKEFLVPGAAVVVAFVAGCDSKEFLFAGADVAAFVAVARKELNEIKCKITTPLRTALLLILLLL